MKIEIIATFFDDEIFAKFFIEHYWWADKIMAIVDTETTDQTPDILRSGKNVSIEYFSYPAGFDDIIKVGMLTSMYKRSTADWVIILDADEFLFTIPQGVGVRRVLESTIVPDVVTAKLFQVYRHHEDDDIDYKRPLLYQRTHGDPNTIIGPNSEFNKPICIRSRKDITILPGQHFIHGNNIVLGGNNIYGAHWCNADPAITIPRRLRAKARQSKSNIEKGLSIQHHNVTKESIQAELDKHLYDPILF